MGKVKITETVFRDAHQSLMATRMRTEDMLPIIETMDKVGFFSFEMWGGATFDVCLRYLDEDPWERLRQFSKVVKKTYLQMLLRGQNLVGYRHYADDIVERFVAKARENGIDIFRVFDAVNDIRNMTTAIRAAKKAGGIVEGTISYTISPVHTIAQYVELAGSLKNVGCDIICIKDMAGFISPNDAYELVKALKNSVGLPVHLHTHCSSGMAPMSYLTACEAGVDMLDTAMSPFAWGTSQPPTESIVAALKGSPFDTGIDQAALSEVCEYFRGVKEKYRGLVDPISERVDPNIVLHQIPGGMLSNLISQLKEQGKMDKYDEVLKETAAVRKDLGYPPLVTPTSQIVGAQAVVNVVTGERYKIIVKEVKDYILGLYGKSPSPVDPELVRKAIGDQEPIKGRPADLLKPEYQKCAVEMAQYSLQEEDVLSYALFPQVATAFFKKRAGQKTEPVKSAPPAGAHAAKLDVGTAAKPGSVEITQAGSGAYKAKVGGREHNVTVDASGDSAPVAVTIDGRRYEVELREHAATAAPVIATPKAPKPAAPPKPAAKPGATHAQGDVFPPMPGKIVDIRVKPGDKVKKGQPLLILEAMKMQNEIDSPMDAVVKEVLSKEGDSVDTTDLMVRLEPVQA
jgi:pyruvate carboxylase subunit B